MTVLPRSMTSPMRRAVARHRHQRRRDRRPSARRASGSARPAAPSRPARSASGSASHAVLPGAERRGPVGLGEAVEMRDAEAHRLHRRDDGRRRRGAAGRDLHDVARSAASRSSGRVDQHRHHDRRAAHVRDAVARDGREDRARDRPGAGTRGCRPPPSPPTCRSSRCSGTSAASTGRRCAARGRTSSALPSALR